MGFKTDIDQTKAAMAAVAACIVQTLHESDPSFLERFEPRLEEWYRAMQERGESHGMETLSWVRDAIRSSVPFQPKD